GKGAVVWRSLLPIAVGHALSISGIACALFLAQTEVSHRTLKIISAALLFIFGVYRLVRLRHPNWVGMRVGFADLTLWSFIMASAHGAGLMLVPLFLKSADAHLGTTQSPMGSHMHSMSGFGFDNISSPSLLSGSIAVHTFGYLLATGSVAMLVYEKLGVGLLRRAWFNIDLFWMLALMIAGLFILFL